MLPRRYWRSYGDTTAGPRRWTNRSRRSRHGCCIRCDRCGKDRIFAETHFAQRNMQLREILKRMRHDGCGGRAGKVELMTGIEGVTSRPVRRIVLLE